MKTYKELKENFFEEVGKVDLSKLNVGFGGLKDYAELLRIMAEIPEEPRDESYKSLINGFALNQDFSGLSTPRIKE